MLAALIPVITLAADGTDRVLFGGAFVVDVYALAFEGFFLVVTYVVLLMSSDYISDGDYYQAEFYFLMLTSVLGMMAMASARDLISIFVALETITIPTFILAGWRKHDSKSNEAMIKYFIIGVLSSAIMLYGMSIVFGETGGSTLLVDIRRSHHRARHVDRCSAVAIFLTIAGFAFKVSAVPFHFWTPDTYEGAPTPVTAFLSTASKAGGFVALLTIIRFGFFPSQDSWEPVLWVLAAASIIFGNLVALRQTNIVRMLAYSSIAQGGFILVPLAVAGDGGAARGVVRSRAHLPVHLRGDEPRCVRGGDRGGAPHGAVGRDRDLRRPGQDGPGTRDHAHIFLFSLAGIPPFAGWFAKFVMFRAVLDANSPSAVMLGVIAALGSVVAFFYYAGVARKMWFHDPAPEAEVAPKPIPAALTVAIGLCVAVTVVVGVYPQLVARIGELAFPI